MPRPGTAKRPYGMFKSSPLDVSDNAALEITRSESGGAGTGQNHTPAKAGAAAVQSAARRGEKPGATRRP